MITTIDDTFVYSPTCVGYSTTADYRRVVVTVKVFLVGNMKLWRCGGTATLILELYITFLWRGVGDPLPMD